MNEKLLEVRALTLGFRRNGRELPAVENISFSLAQGQTLCIVGESGCGKSVSVSSILRLLPKKTSFISSGEILFRGQDILKMSEAELDRIRGNEISMIFQEPMTSLNPTMPIGKQLMESLMTHRNVSRGEAREHCEQMLLNVGIQDPKRRMKEYPHQFSGGMRQRVMIAMAMLCNPAILIADEPTTALDVTVQAQILDLIAQLKEEYNTAILLITHDMGVVAETADEVIVMYAGQVVEHSDVESLFAAPKHPYTRGLLAALPRIGEEQTRLYNIEGTVPSLGNMPEGCRFAERCTERSAACTGPIPLYSHDRAMVRCALFQEGGAEG